MFIINILQETIDSGLIWAVLAVGVFVSFRILDFPDLTVEGSFVLGAAISAKLMSLSGFFSNSLVSIIFAVIGGVLAGVLTGVLNVKLKIPGILAGIISMTALYGINLIIMGGANLVIDYHLSTIYKPMELLLNSIFKLDIGLLNFLTKAITNSLIIGILLFVLYWFFGTEIGMGLRASGNNLQMAKAQGINTDRMTIAGLAISNGIIALAGALFVQSFKISSMDLGRGTIIIGLSAIIIGESIFGKKTFKNWLISVLLGGLIYQLILVIAITLGLTNLKLLQAIIVTIILAQPQVTLYIKKLIKKKGGTANA